MTVKTAQNKKNLFVRLFMQDSYEARKPVFFLVFGVFILMCIIYFSLLFNTIFNAVTHQSLEKQIPRANADLQEKRFEYIALRNNLNKDKATELGLIVLNDESIEYITRDSVGFHTGN